MARKGKTGLDYFPHSVNFDDELEYLIAMHKELGYYIYFRLLERIYKDDGYFCKWDNKNKVLFSGKFNIEINKLNLIVDTCLQEGLFDKEIYKNHQVLTSRGIQTRFIDATQRRKQTVLIADYILINEDFIKSINVNILMLNVDGSTQSKVKESKVKESIGDRKKNFLESINSFSNIYSKKIIESFFNHWSQDNGEKMLFELKEIFSIENRLKNWNSREWSKEKIENQDELSYAELLILANNDQKIMAKYKAIEKPGGSKVFVLKSTIDEK